MAPKPVNGFALVRIASPSGVASHVAPRTSGIEKRPWFLWEISNRVSAQMVVNVQSPLPAAVRLDQKLSLYEVDKQGSGPHEAVSVARMLR